MKHIIKVILFLTMIALTTGCGQKVEKDAQNAVQKVDFQIGVEADNAPYYYTGEDGEAAGIYVDMMKELAAREDFSFSFLEMSASDFYTMAEEKKCDAFLGTLEKETGDLSILSQTDVFYQTKLCLVVKKDSRITKRSELRDCSIASRADTGEEMFASYLAVKYDAVSLGFRGQAEILNDVEQGFSKAFVIDEQNFKVIKQNNISFTTIKKSETFYNNHRFTVGDNEELLDKLNRGLQSLMEDGTITNLFAEN